MSDPRRRLGQQAEDLVAARLASMGWRILARNARTRRGEIDLIAGQGDCLVFVEVKAGRATAQAGPEKPILAVGPRKQARLRLLAREWLAGNSLPVGCQEIRFDVVGITYDGRGRLLDYEHIESAF